MTSKKIILFSFLYLILFTNHTNAKVRFVRVIFNSDASNSCSIIWDQVSGDFTSIKFYDVHSKIKREQSGIYYIDGKRVNNYTSYTFETNSIKPRVILRKKNFTVNRSNGLKNHVVRLCNIKGKNSFEIVDSEGTSQRYYFSCVSNSPDDTLSFIAGGDSRSNRKTRQKANLLVSKLYAHAVLFNGDFTAIDTPKQWEQWFEDWELSIANDGRITPMVVTRGNHELSNKVMVDLFDVPHKRAYYSTEFGGNLLNIISLNSEILKIGRQKLFLRTTLKKHKNFYWQIPQYHRPIRPHVSFKREIETQYRNFVPLFEKYKNVRLCLENDSHTCKVTWPIVSSQGTNSSEGFERNDQVGITYIGEGCWGAPLRKADDLKPWTRDAEAINQFNWIFVSRKKIEVRTVLYENADQVEELSEETRFTIPINLNLWSPKNGSLVEIYPQNK